MTHYGFFLEIDQRESRYLGGGARRANEAHAQPAAILGGQGGPSVPRRACEGGGLSANTPPLQPPAEKAW